MKRYRISDEVPLRVQLSWLNLSFTAGAINAGGFLSCQRFVSHVTGFVTISGLNFGQQAWSEAVSALSIPTFFLLGAIVSALLTEEEGNASDLSRRFGYGMGIVAGALLFIIYFGMDGYFGPFGASDKISADYLLLALLCGVCGLQNAAVTSLTGASIRPTHLTGTTTDIGIGLVRAMRTKIQSPEYQKERRTNRRRINLVLAFVVGVMIGSYFFLKFEYLGFALPLLTSLVSMGESILENRNSRQEQST